MPDRNLYLHPSIDSVVVLGAALVVLVFIRVFSLLSFATELLFTMVHELGHVFVTRFAGGRTVYFRIFPNTDGEAKRLGGEDRFIIPAGYVGTALFSASLIVLSSWPALASYILLSVGFFLTALTLTFGRVSRLTLFIGLLFGLGFIWIALQTHLVWSILLLNILGIQGGIIALERLRNMSLDETSDAGRMAKLTGRSPHFWARAWVLLSLLFLGSALWFTWLRHWPQ